MKTSLKITFVLWLFIVAFWVPTSCHVTLPEWASANDAYKSTPMEEGPITFEDLNLPIADNTNAFRYIDGSVFDGWCITEGVVSDLLIDLDNDSKAERIIVYIAPSIWAPETDRSYYLVSDQDVLGIDADEGDGGVTNERASLEHLPERRDLRMAVFQQVESTFIKTADIIIEQSLAFNFANIRISVWGDQEKYIYLHSATCRYDHISSLYAVLSYQGDMLKVELALYAETFCDSTSLTELTVDDVTKLYSASDSGGDRIYSSSELLESASANDTQQQKPLVRKPQQIYEYADDIHSSFISEEQCDPAHLSGNIASEIQSRLAKYGIDDTQDEKPNFCTPICAIRYIGLDGDLIWTSSDPVIDWEQMIDYTRIVQ